MPPGLVPVLDLDLLRNVMEKLPAQPQGRWRRHAVNTQDTGRCDVFEDLVSIVGGIICSSTRAEFVALRAVLEAFTTERDQFLNGKP